MIDVDVDVALAVLEVGDLLLKGFSLVNEEVVIPLELGNVLVLLLSFLLELLDTLWSCALAA